MRKISLLINTVFVVSLVLLFSCNYKNDTDLATRDKLLEKAYADLKSNDYTKIESSLRTIVEGSNLPLTVATDLQNEYNKWESDRAKSLI